MQGNEHLDFDEQFASKGWEQMREMLDSEMPVEAATPVEVTTGSGTKYISALLILFIGFSIGVGVMYLYQNEQQEHTAEKEPQALNHSTEIIDQDHQKQVKEIDNENNTLVPSITKSTIKPLQPLSSVKTSKSVENTKRKNLEIEYISSNENLRSDIQSATFSELSPLSSKKVKPLVYNMATTLISQKNDLVKSAKQWDIVGELPAIATKLESKIDKLDVAKLTKPSSYATLNLLHPTRYGVTVGVQSLDTRKRDGFTAGLLVEYDLNPEMTFQTGLVYTKNTRQRDVKINIALEEEIKEAPVSGTGDPYIATTGSNEPEQAPNQTINPDKDSQVENFTSSTSSVFNKDNTISALERLTEMNYIQLPLSMSFKLEKGIYLNAGLNAAYLLSAKGFDQEKFEIELLNEYPDDNLLIPELKKGIRNIDLSAIVGVSIYPAPNLGFDFKANLGLIDYTQNNIYLSEQKSINTTMQFSLLYFMGRK